MNILILGSGGREHAMAWKIAQSPLCTKLWVAPGNAGTQQIASNLPLDIKNFEAVKTAVLTHQIDMLVVGPEDPLVLGIVDFFENDSELNHIQVVGPSKHGAQLEGSKEFAKEFMSRHNIPTAAYGSFTAETLHEAYRFLEEMQPPYVLKADGLAAGKGVLIIDNLNEAKLELQSMLVDKKFGLASTKVVIEEFLSGIELSCFVLTDGSDYILLPMAKDYKRIGEADTGLNTGGMGAVSPVPFADAAFLEKIEEKIVKPTINGLRKEQINYKGFVFVGLIKVDNEPYVIEYNVRMGDPETEVVLPRLTSDLVSHFKALFNGNLKNELLSIDERFAATVMLVSGGYPEAYENGKTINGFENATPDSLVFHAGTKNNGEDIITAGGRVLAITSYGNSVEEATKKSYQNIENLHFDKMYFRKDIGQDLF
jgi:phosphoribosylamine---glycine ligase